MAVEAVGTSKCCRVIIIDRTRIKGLFAPELFERTRRPTNVYQCLDCWLRIRRQTGESRMTRMIISSYYILHTIYFLCKYLYWILIYNISITFQFISRCKASSAENQFATFGWQRAAANTIVAKDGGFPWDVPKQFANTFADPRFTVFHHHFLGHQGPYRFQLVDRWRPGCKDPIWDQNAESEVVKVLFYSILHMLNFKHDDCLDTSMLLELQNTDQVMKDVSNLTTKWSFQ